MRNDMIYDAAIIGASRPYQYAKAVGEGNFAAHSTLEYLSELEKTGKNKFNGAGMRKAYRPLIVTRQAAQ